MLNPIATPRFPHHPENVPAELKTDERWVTCDEYKVPLIAIENGACFAASSTNADTWRSYETAFRTYQENEHIAGVGRVIETNEPYVGVDLDDCLEPKTGEITAWAQTIIERLNSYAEISPSLSGIKIWVKAPEVTRAYKKPGLEVYPRGRYFTVTGLILDGNNQALEERNKELRAILDEEFPKVERERHPAGSYHGTDRVLDLGELLDRGQVAIFTELSDGSAERKYAIRCPWIEEHTDEDESGTYCGQYENGALFFACYHAHCARRGWRHFRHQLECALYLGRAARRGGRLR
jgi:hypothetical protein